MTNSSSNSKHIVLLGAGHTHAHVVRMWAMQPIAGAQLTLVSDNAIATYSGMLPAVLAGQNTRPDMQIDLVQLCSVAGVRLILEPAVGLGESKASLRFAERPEMPFDCLSIGIGSIPNMQGAVSASGELPDLLVTIKPMQTFLERLENVLERVATRVAGARPLRIAVVGSGIAGTEIAFCLPGLLRSQEIDASVEVVTRSDAILPGVNARARRLVLTEFERRNVAVTTGAEVLSTDAQGLMVRGSSQQTLQLIAADVVLWATGAVGPPLLSELGLELDGRGFIRTDDHLRSLTHSGVFAVGDSGTIEGAELAKAGVYAVRQGPVLWENLQRHVCDQPTIAYKPQRNFLKLINTGQGSAVASWGPVALQGRWVKRWKDRIDTTFMQKYRLSPMESDGPMQCRGCGSKLPAHILRDALRGAGGGKPIEDAVEIGDGNLLASTDFFSLPLDDPYTNGRIAALHACSDVIASGGMPTEALATVVVPEGQPAGGQQWLAELLAGARLELDAMGADIVAGHTIVGPRSEAGFAIIARRKTQSMLQKAALQPGDRLLLTRPLGIGVALAALMRGCCPADVYQSALDAMLGRQHAFVEIAAKLKIAAATDVTGFGLAGHLLEMLAGSGVGAELKLSSVPILPGVVELTRQGIQSSLHPENARVASQLDIAAELEDSGELPLLFDPQTCGGLLFAVPPSQVDLAQAEFSDAGLGKPVDIAVVTDRPPGQKALRVV